MDESLSEYISESEEILQRVFTAFSEIEKGAPVDKLIDAIYRDFHTLKGSSQLFGIGEISRIAHCLEAAFGPIRAHRLKVSGRIIGVVFKSMRLIDSMLKVLRGGSKALGHFEEEIKVVLPSLIDAANQEFGVDYSLLTDTHWSENVATDPGYLNGEFAKNLEKSQKSQVKKEADIVPKKETPKQVLKSEPIMKSDKKSEITEPQKPSAQTVAKPEKLEVARKPEKSEMRSEVAGPAIDTTIRVHVDLLDRLMNLAGELVLVRNQVTGQPSAASFFSL